MLFNNHFETGRWDEIDMNLFAEYGSPKTDKDKLKFANSIDFVTRWDEKFKAHAPIVSSPDKIIEIVEKSHKATSKAIKTSLVELSDYFGEIKWGETQIAPHINDNFGIGWTVRIEGVLIGSKIKIQFNSASFYAQGAGQRFFRYETNKKRAWVR